LPYYYRYAITNKDTVINMKSYHQIFYSLTDSLFIDPANYNYIGCLREYNKQIFFIPMDSVNEYLIYDFSKKIGDTILYNYSVFAHEFGMGHIDTLIVSNIDSVLLNNGKYRKRFSLTDVWNTPSLYYSHWIEGIGSDNGLIWPVGAWPTNGLNNYLVCFQQNKNEIYFNNLFSTCLPINYSMNENFASNRLNIFPNPFSQSTQINLFLPFHNIALAVYDIQGRQVAQQVYVDCDQIQFSRDQLSNGLYFLKLTLDDKTVETGKIIISE
jgi:hypothetical protein